MTVDKKIDEKYSFSSDIQKKIVAMLIKEDRTFKENVDLVKPEFLDSPVLKDLLVLVTCFFEKYSRVPMEDEFLEELDSFLEGNKKLPNDEYMDVAEKVISLSRQHDFKYVKNKVKDFARFQAMRRALLKAGEEKLKKRDFQGIVKLVNEAADIGNHEGQVTCLADIQAEKIKWLWDNRIPEGKLSLLVGDPGIGKSFFTIFMAAHITTGKPWPDESQMRIGKGKVLMLTAEDGLADTVRPRADAAGADVKNIYVIEGVEEGRLLNLSRNLYKLEDILKRDRDFKLIVIDPLSAYLGYTDTHRDSDVRQTLAPLSFLAEKYEVAIVGVLHLNKKTVTQALYRVSGSVGFIASARSVWLIAWDRDEEKRRFFLPMKTNLSRGKIENLAFSIEKGEVVFEKEPVKDLDIEEVLAPQEKVGEGKKARKFLLEMLKDGAVSAKEIKSAARDEGFSWWTVKKVKEKMYSIKSFKERGEPGGKWYWKLDDATRWEVLTEEGIEPEDIKDKVEAAKARAKKTKECSDAEEG